MSKRNRIRKRRRYCWNKWASRPITITAQPSLLRQLLGTPPIDLSRPGHERLLASVSDDYLAKLRKAVANLAEQRHADFIRNALFGRIAHFTDGEALPQVTTRGPNGETFTPVF